MKKNQSNRPDVYSRVTERIVELLEEGTLPWEPAHIAAGGMPRNLASQKAYRGINSLLLGSLRYSNPWFVTYRQAQAMDGHVLQGQRGYLVLKWGKFDPKDTRDEPGSESKPRHYLRSYTVFHAPSQTEGLSIPAAPNVHPNYKPSEKRDLLERVVQEMPRPPTIQEGRSYLPSYTPATDHVDMPDRKSFLSEDAYYKTLFHELGHSTGHKSRLARPSLMSSDGIRAASDEGKKRYCEEELVAETASAFLFARLGIVPEQENAWDTAAYIGGWLQALKVKENKRWVVRAAAQAQKASDYILEPSEGTD